MIDFQNDDFLYMKFSTFLGLFGHNFFSTKQVPNTYIAKKFPEDEISSKMMFKVR